MAEDLTYQQMLRTLGTLLDCAAAQTATLTVAPQRAEVEVPHWPQPRVWDREGLAAEISAQQRWRSRPRGRALPWAGRNSQDLRAVGRVLDARGPGPYTVALGPRAVRVRENGNELCAWPRSQ